MDAGAVTYSIVIPVFNEEQALPVVLGKLRALLDELDAPAEIVFVDDGSRDKSYAILAAAAKEDARLRCVRLSRNFGHQVAIAAGVDFAGGDAVVIMDADMQDPPAVVHEMIKKWREGFHVVYGRRRLRKGEAPLKRFTAHLFYRALGKLSDVELPVDVGDFRLMDRAVVDALRGMREHNRYMRGMIAWLGFAQTAVDYDREERVAGVTKYPLPKMLRLAANGVVGFSTMPLRLALSLGFFVSGMSFLLGLGAIGAYFGGAFVVPGWASIIVAVFFAGGVQLIVLGVIGEYIGRIYDEVRRRPLYLVREQIGPLSTQHRLRRETDR